MQLASFGRNIFILLALMFLALLGQVHAADFGDAPDSYGTNAQDNNGEGVGASHTLGLDAYIGNVAPDEEADAAPGVNADGDNTAGSDDESGLYLSNLSTKASSYTIQVRVVNNSATTLYLAGWLAGWIETKTALLIILRLEQRPLRKVRVLRCRPIRTSITHSLGQA